MIIYDVLNESIAIDRNEITAREILSITSWHTRLDPKKLNHHSTKYNSF